MVILVGVSTTLAGAIVLYVLLITGVSLIGALLYGVVDLAKEISQNYRMTIRYYCSIVKIQNVTIDSVTWIDTDATVNMTIVLNNPGEEPLWDFTHSDIFVTYLVNGSNKLETIRLTYGSNWTIESVLLTENYSVQFSSHPLIEQGESGVIKVSFTAPINMTHPIRIVFVSQYGSRAAVWVDVG